MSVLMEIWHAIQAVVTSADYYTLGAAVVIIVVAGFLIEDLRSILSATIGALLVFVLAKCVLAMTVGDQHDLEVLARGEWRAFLSLPMLILLAHTLVFGVLIGIVSTIRSIIR